jgi:hypothetical protein
MGAEIIPVEAIARVIYSLRGQKSREGITICDTLVASKIFETTQWRQAAH